MTISAKNFFTKKEKEDIKKAIVNAELDTSGEIRVHIDQLCSRDVMDNAAYIFKNLNMQKTKLRNGVLIYLAIKNKKFAIIGDIGINKVVPENFWDSIKDKMLENFKEGNFTNGICEAITLSGKQLKKYFPYQKDDINELPDDISFGK